jgi:2-polyprenyl-6-hydroxyphenyl methylase/3-demethylubiquinone-9 3-methyltransferase
MTGTAVEAEIRKFGALAARWWDPDGPMKPLHRMNPLRTGWIAERIARAHGRTGRDLAGLRLLDVGCGAGTPEEMAAEGATFDAVVALEVLEHVEDRAAFLGALAALTAPGGQVFLSTLNRTARSFLMAKVGAEYVLRMLPVGTHDWRMFVTPGELGAGLRKAGLRVTGLAGMSMDPLTGRWRESRDLGVNYLMVAER